MRLAVPCFPSQPQGITMCTCDGLSLTEVLVSLFIVTSASLALLQQQWHVSQYITQVNHRHDTHSQWENRAEQLVARVFKGIE